MEMQWISTLYDLPRCRAAGADGRRCCVPVVWDEATNRPVSTRCQAHAGLIDAALTGRRSPDLKEMARTTRFAAGLGDILVNSVNKLRTIGLGRSLIGLPALALAGLLCLSMTGPALADFESAVATYERGDYQEARKEFEALAAAGDERAKPYLESIQIKLEGGPETEETIASAITDSLDSIFNAPDRPSFETVSTEDTEGSWWSFSSGSPQSASGGKPAGWEPWSPFDPSAETTTGTSAPVADVVVPERDSFWSTLFHLPGDATVVGLQYAAKFLEAETLSRELQFLSRHRDEITLSILAGFWWLVIIRGVVGVGMSISRFMKAAATIREAKHYG